MMISFRESKRRPRGLFPVADAQRSPELAPGPGSVENRNNKYG
jgi:hypothetical protein